MTAKNLAVVNAVMFDAARTYIDTEYRVALQCVFIQPHPKGGAVMVATDGHRLVVLHDAKGQCARPCQITVDKGFARALKAAKSTDVVAVSGAGLPTIPGLFAGSGPALSPAGFSFPEYRRLIGLLLDLLKEKARGPASFNGRYLAEAAKIGQRLTGNKGEAMRVVSFGPSDMCLTLWPGVDYAFGFLMPMRTVDVEAIPAFFEPVMRGYEPLAEAA